MQSAPNSHHFLSIVFSVFFPLAAIAEFMTYKMNRKQKHTQPILFSHLPSLSLSLLKYTFLYYSKIYLRHKKKEFEE